MERRRQRRGSVGSRGLPPAARVLPGGISPWFHHPPPALKEKFLLRARGSGHPSRAEVQGLRWPCTPRCTHCPPPPHSGPSHSCHVCTEGARHQLAELRCHGLGLSTAALPARGGWPAFAQASGLRGSPRPNTDASPLPLTSSCLGASPLCTPVPSKGTPAPASPWPSPAALHHPLPHSFPFSTHPLQVPEPSPSLHTRHQHHHRSLETPAAAACLCQRQRTPACSPQACS
ncbi:splicing factor 3B subunit 4-like [Harpia harpyja]|uniref:splicing factor 3B subunit 4-like n=1 Tax=Harpia harpyja TaxID=202280 RepID=UPI0022B0EF1F|nr:splicing factor 3B subunit 4-like [Harpia harpyja]